MASPEATAANDSSETNDASGANGTPIAIDKRKAIVLGGIGLVVIVLIFWKVIPQVGSYADAWDALSSMGALAFAVIAVAVVAYLAAYGLPFMAAAPGLRYWRSQQVNQAAFAISNGVPAGGAVGLAVQFGMLTSFSVTPTSATAAITAVGLWSTFISLGLPVLGVTAFVIAGGGDQYTGLAVAGLLILVVSVAAFVLVMRSPRIAASVGALGNRLINPLRPRVSRLRDLDVAAPIIRFRADMDTVLRTRWLHITGSVVLVALAQFAALYVALRGVEGWDKPGTSMLAAFAAFGTSQIMLMVPVTPGGLGTVDALLISILGSLGTAPGAATAADLVWRATSYVPQIVLGVVAIVAWSRAAGRKFAAA